MRLAAVGRLERSIHLREAAAEASGAAARTAALDRLDDPRDLANVASRKHAPVKARLAAIERLAGDDLLFEVGQESDNDKVTAAARAALGPRWDALEQEQRREEDLRESIAEDKARREEQRLKRQAKTCVVCSARVKQVKDMFPGIATHQTRPTGYRCSECQRTICDDCWTKAMNAAADMNIPFNKIPCLNPDCGEVPQNIGL